MINRPDYIEAVKPFIDKPLVSDAAGSPPFLRC